MIRQILEWFPRNPILNAVLSVPAGLSESPERSPAGHCTCCIQADADIREILERLK